MHLEFGAVLHLEDLLLRRARVGMWNPPLARTVAATLREVFAQQFGWDTATWERETERFEQAQQAWAPEGVT